MLTFDEFPLFCSRDETRHLSGRTYSSSWQKNRGYFVTWGGVLSLRSYVVDLYYVVRSREREKVPKKAVAFMVTWLTFLPSHLVPAAASYVAYVHVASCGRCGLSRRVTLQLFIYFLLSFGFLMTEVGS